MQDHNLRRSFIDWTLDHLKTDPLFYRKIVFSDEVHFWLNRFVNKQNIDIEWYQPRKDPIDPSHSEILTVWCILHGSNIIEPYFF